MYAKNSGGVDMAETINLTDAFDALEDQWKSMAEERSYLPLLDRYVGVLKLIGKDQLSKLSEIERRFHALAAPRAYKRYRRTYKNRVKFSAVERHIAKEIPLFSMLDALDWVEFVDDPEMGDIAEMLVETRVPIMQDPRFLYLYAVEFHSAFDLFLTGLLKQSDPKIISIGLEAFAEMDEDDFAKMAFDSRKEWIAIRSYSVETPDDIVHDFSDIPGLGAVSTLRQINSPFAQLVADRYYTATRLFGIAKFLAVIVFTLGFFLAISIVAVRAGFGESDFVAGLFPAQSLAEQYLKALSNEASELSWANTLVLAFGAISLGFALTLVLGKIALFVGQNIRFLRKPRLSRETSFAHFDTDVPPFIVLTMVEKMIAKYIDQMPESDAKAARTSRTHTLPFEANLARFGLARYGKRAHDSKIRGALYNVVNPDSPLRPALTRFSPRELGIITATISVLFVGAFLSRFGLDARITVTEFWSKLRSSPEVVVNTTPPLAVAEYGTITADSLRHRSCPNTDCPVVGSSQRGDRIQILNTRSGWYQLNSSSAESEHWVSGDYVTLDPTGSGID
jgi:hypothetical protein